MASNISHISIKGLFCCPVVLFLLFEKKVLWIPRESNLIPVDRQVRKSI